MSEVLGSVAPLPAASVASPSVATEVCDAFEREADMACLRAAKGCGLIRKQGGNLASPTSEFKGIGWWARSSWSEHRADPTKGGPWTVERVSRLCELGFLGASPDATDRTALLRPGAALLRKPKGVATTPDDTREARRERSERGRPNTKTAPEPPQKDNGQ